MTPPVGCGLRYRASLMVRERGVAEDAEGTDSTRRTEAREDARRLSRRVDLQTGRVAGRTAGEWQRDEGRRTQSTEECSACFESCAPRPVAARAFSAARPVLRASPFVFVPSCRTRDLRTLRQPPPANRRLTSRTGSAWLWRQPRQRRSAADDLFGTPPRRAQVANPAVPIGLAQLLGRGFHDERVMDEHGSGVPANQARQPDLPAGRGQQILAANDERHALHGVIDRCHTLVGPVPESIAQQQVATLRRWILLLSAEQLIMEPFEPGLEPRSADESIDWGIPRSRPAPGSGVRRMRRLACARRPEWRACSGTRTASGRDERRQRRAIIASRSLCRPSHAPRR